MAEHSAPYPFASAHPTRIASSQPAAQPVDDNLCLSTSHTDCVNRWAFRKYPDVLCLSTSHTDCVESWKERLTALGSLPQHIPHGLRHMQLALTLAERYLCLSTSHTDCVCQRAAALAWQSTLPQHIPHGLRLLRFPVCLSGSIFASAHPTRIASTVPGHPGYQSQLCLSTSHTDCVRCFRLLRPAVDSLPQHIPHGLRLAVTPISPSPLLFASAHPTRIASANMHKNIRFFVKRTVSW